MISLTKFKCYHNQISYLSKDNSIVTLDINEGNINNKIDLCDYDIKDLLFISDDKLIFIDTNYDMFYCTESGKNIQKIILDVDILPEKLLTHCAEHHFYVVSHDNKLYTIIISEPLIIHKNNQIKYVVKSDSNNYDHINSDKIINYDCLFVYDRFFNDQFECDVIQLEPHDISKITQINETSMSIHYWDNIILFTLIPDPNNPNKFCSLNCYDTKSRHNFKNDKMDKQIKNYGITSINNSSNDNYLILESPTHVYIYKTVYIYKIDPYTQDVEEIMSELELFIIDKPEHNITSCYLMNDKFIIMTFDTVFTYYVYLEKNDNNLSFAKKIKIPSEGLPKCDLKYLRQKSARTNFNVI